MRSTMHVKKALSWLRNYTEIHSCTCVRSILGRAHGSITDHVLHKQKKCQVQSLAFPVEGSQAMALGKDLSIPEILETKLS